MKYYKGNKIPLNSPLLINNKVASDFGGKENHFSDAFVLQYTTIANKSTLPLDPTHVSNVRLSFIIFKDKEILKTMHYLNIHKGLGSGNIFIRFLKTYDSAVVKPLFMIFRNCLKTGTFPGHLETSIIAPVLKKRDRKLFKSFV